MNETAPLTCDQIADTWTERYPRPDRATNAVYSGAVKGFGRDFRHRDPNSIDRTEARAWAVAHPNKLRYVRTMFNDLLNDGLIAVNHFADLRLPRSRGRKDIIVPTVGQVQELIEAARSHDTAFAEAVRFTAYTGLRVGELRAIERVDLLGEHRAYIAWQIDRYEKRKPAKTEGKIFLPPPLHELEQSMLLVDGRIWPYTLNRFKTVWKRTRKACGIWIQFHELRHFCATWLLDQGATAEDVAQQLRHNDGGQLVRELYGHPDEDLALGRLEELVTA